MMSLEKLNQPEAISESEVIQDAVEPMDESLKETSESSYESTGCQELKLSQLETTELVTDLEMTEGIADYLESVEEIKLENWSKLSLEQKQVVLNRIEQHVAAIEHRPALRVELEQMPPKTWGYQDTSENKIALNAQYVAMNNPKFHQGVIDTILHEGRHAYQHYNVEVKCIHESGSEVDEWRKNFYDPELGYYQRTGQKIMIPYNDGTLHDVDNRLYFYQPVEVDARNFAREIISRLKYRGIF